MTKMNGKSTVKDKVAFESIAEAYNSNVRHNHSDNDIFDTKVFKASVNKAKQKKYFVE